MTADRVEVQGSQAGRKARQRDRVIGVTPFGRPAPRLVVAVARAGGLAVLDLGRDRQRALAALEQVGRWWDGSFAVRLTTGCPVRPEELPEAVDTIVVDAPALAGAQPFHGRGRRMLVEVVDPAEAHPAVRQGADGLIGGLLGRRSGF